MRYFLLEQDSGYINIPRPVNWFEKLTPGKAMESVKKLPNREIFGIETGENPVFLDLMTNSMVLMSEKVKKCLSLYEPNMPFKEIILMDRKRRVVHNYFVPTLAEIDCLTENSEYTNWNYDLKYIELDSKKLRDKTIFTIKGPKKQKIVIRLDAAESLLRRGAKGMMLKEVEVE